MARNLNKVQQMLKATYVQGVATTNVKWELENA